jgi:hypothetical protein
VNRRSFLLAIAGSGVAAENPCSDQEVNQALREIEVRKLAPRQRNREWNILVWRFRIFSCRLQNVGLELKAIERQPQVVSLGSKRAIAEAERALKALIRGFRDLKETV